MPEHPVVRKVLIIRFSSLGDIVLTSLLVRCLKKQLGCEIHYLTKNSFKDLVSSNPNIDKVWLLNNKIANIIPVLKAEHYDLIIDLHKNLRSLLIRFHLWNIPAVSYHKANVAKWLAVQFKIHRFPKNHIALRYLHTLKKYNVQDDGHGLDYFIPTYDQIDLQSIPVTTPYIALVIGAAHFTKRIPLIKLQELIASLDVIYPILIIGGPAESAAGQLLASDRVINTCGKYNINQSASLLNQAAFVVAPDTGMMHIAAALKKPIRSIWGSTLAEFGFWPFYGFNHKDLNVSFEIKGLSCRPCARFGRQSCPEGHFKCMMLQDMKSVADILH